MLSGEKVCNFLIHPSVSTNDQDETAERIGEFLNQMIYDKSQFSSIINHHLKNIWEDLQKTKPDIKEFTNIRDYIEKAVSEEKIKVIVMHSKSKDVPDYNCGLNIVIGGNILSRGITLPRLQTVYYCRKSKKPNADTYWQHSRMFGYDRDRELMRVYLPPSLIKLFTELNSGNKVIIDQINKGTLQHATLLYSKNIQPTRSNVVDKQILKVHEGGVNYFSRYPARDNLKEIDSLLEGYKDETHTISVELIIKLLNCLKNKDSADWDNAHFIESINLLKGKGYKNGKLILARNRDLRKDPTTMLSEGDRKEGDKYKKEIVITLYRLEGVGKSWESDPGSRWIPNIKLPEGVFYTTING